MNETFGQRLKRLREAKGLTTRQLSDSVRENEPLLINLENGISLPQFQKSVDMYRLAKALGVTMDYLYSGVEPPSWADTPGKRIRLRRDELGWTPIELADESKVSWMTLAHLELDHSKYAQCSGGAVCSIAKSLGVTPEWILTGAEPKFPPKPKEPDAEWFKGFTDSPEIEDVRGKDLEDVVCCFYVKKGMGAKVLELIRTGKMPEGRGME